MARFHLQRRDWQAASVAGGAHRALHRASLRSTSRGHGHAWVCVGRARPSRGGDRRDTPGPGGHANHRAEVGRRWFLAQLAEAYGAGRPQRGWPCWPKRWRPCPQPGNTAGAGAVSPPGELLLALSAEQHTEAAACFQQALNVARQQQAKSLELRAAMSLSRLWQQQGQVPPAGTGPRSTAGSPKV